MYVPPPVDELGTCLDELEKFIHQKTPELPPLVKAGLIHVQFESIHPFLDGNGRLGRLLVTLFLCAEGVLNQPLLYLSLYLKRHRETYYRLLQEVRERGTWEAWLEFFLEGVTETAQQAHQTANKIVDLFARDRAKISAGQRANSALRVYEKMQKSPFLTASKARDLTGLTLPTINTAFAELQRLEIVTEVTGKAWGRVYSYKAYVDLLNEGA
jgi:Fic family protein